MTVFDAEDRELNWVGGPSLLRPNGVGGSKSPSEAVRIDGALVHQDICTLVADVVVDRMWPTPTMGQGPG